MLSSLSDYQTCVNHSEKVYWDLEEAISEIKLDFRKPFLPAPLARASDIDFLNEKELLLLNQIHGHSYAHLFIFVEEFIISQVLKMAGTHLHGDSVAMRALLRFCEEEVKHQKLFEAFKVAFSAGFPVQCRTITDKERVARNVTESSSLAVMLLISMLEWITQKHYLSCFREGGRDIDKSFARLFHLHWLEEAQHAKLDSLEIDRIARGLPADERKAGVSEFITLCAAVDGLLIRQAELDLENFLAASRRHLSDEEKARILASQLSGIRWTFLGCGLEHAVFLKIIQDISPGQVQDVASLAHKYC